MPYCGSWNVDASFGRFWWPVGVSVDVFGGRLYVRVSWDVLDVSRSSITSRSSVDIPSTDCVANLCDTCTVNHTLSLTIAESIGTCPGILENHHSLLTLQLLYQLCMVPYQLCMVPYQLCMVP